VKGRGGAHQGSRAAGVVDQKRQPCRKCMRTAGGRGGKRMGAGTDPVGSPKVDIFQGGNQIQKGGSAAREDQTNARHGILRGKSQEKLKKADAKEQRVTMNRKAGSLLPRKKRLGKARGGGKTRRLS